VGFCQAWGLGFFLYYNPCVVDGAPSCSDACLTTWTEVDRTAVWYEGQVKAFLFSTLYGENWTSPTGSRFVSVAARNNIVVNTTRAQHASARDAAVGTIDSLTKGWGQNGLSIMNCMQNWVTAYKGGFKANNVGGYKPLSNAAPDAAQATTCPSTDGALGNWEIAAAALGPAIFVCAVVIGYLHFVLSPRLIQNDEEGGRRRWKRRGDGLEEPLNEKA
jgi:hypothetical protein